MKVKVFAIRDSKVEAFNQPFFSATKGSAIRAVTTALSDSSSNYCKFAEDFSLFELGTFDDSTGMFELLSSPLHLGLLVEFRKDKDVVKN